MHTKFSAEHSEKETSVTDATTARSSSRTCSRDRSIASHGKRWCLAVSVRVSRSSRGSRSAVRSHRSALTRSVTGLAGRHNTRKRVTFRVGPLHGQTPEKANTTRRHAKTPKLWWEQNCDRTVSPKNKALLRLLHDRHMRRSSSKKVLDCPHQRVQSSLTPV